MDDWAAAGEPEAAAMDDAYIYDIRNWEGVDLPQTSTLAPVSTVLSPLNLIIVRDVVSAERPEVMIPTVSSDPTLAQFTSHTVQHWLGELTATDVRDRFETCTEEALAQRRQTNEVLCRPTQPLGVIGTEFSVECTSRRGVHMLDVPLDQAGPGSARHCLKSTYRTLRDGMPVILEWGGMAWGFGILSGNALRRGDVIWLTVMIVDTIDRNRNLLPMNIHPQALPRWCNGTVACQGDALVPDLAYALQYTPDDAALNPFRVFCSHHVEIVDRMRRGAPFYVTCT